MAKGTTSWWEWLQKHRMQGESDAEFARRLGVPRTQMLYWKRGAEPTLQTVKDAYWALKLPGELFWDTVRLIFEPMLKSTLPLEIRVLPQDHICRAVLKYIPGEQLDEFLRVLKVTHRTWESWMRDEDLDLPFKTHSRVITMARNWVPH